MAQPVTREQFKDTVMRKLGWPVVEINVDDDQVDDRIDDALYFFREFHEDGTYNEYYRHLITTDDITNKYIDVSETTTGLNIIGIRKILPVSNSNNIGDMFDLRYQMRLNDLQSGTGIQATSYYIMRQHLADLQMLFTGEAPTRHNRHMNKLFIDWDWVNDISAGQYIILDCQIVSDPETYPDIYADRNLQELAALYLKKQWGTNMKKYQGVQLIGGVEMNGQTIYDEAMNEIQAQEEFIRATYEQPPMFFTG